MLVPRVVGIMLRPAHCRSKGAQRSDPLIVAMVLAFCLQGLAMRLEVTTVSLSITIVLELQIAFVSTDDTTGVFNGAPIRLCT